MKTILAGSRSINNLRELNEAIRASGFAITEVVSGEAAGVDRLGVWWAGQHSVPVVRFRPDWRRYGKQAGFLRNAEMANYADALVVVWNGRSAGTKHMIDLAREKGLKVYVRLVERKRA